MKEKLSSRNIDLKIFSVSDIILSAAPRPVCATFC